MWAGSLLPLTITMTLCQNVRILELSYYNGQMAWSSPEGGGQKTENYSLIWSGLTQ